MESIVEQVVFGNSLQAWAVALGTFLLTFVVLLVLKSVIRSRLQRLAEKSKTRLDDLVVELIGKTKTVLLALIALYAASLALDLSPKAARVVHSVTIIAILLQATFWGNAVIGYWLQRQRDAGPEDDATRVPTATVISFIARTLLYSLAVLLVLDNLGIDVTALVASLGIGGVAVALAVQNILGDLFACVSISLDKPFVIGDFIIIDEYMGVVERVGLKTTRIRSLFGEQLIFANNDLLKSRIRNYKRMQERRVVFTFGVVYQTPYEQLREIPEIVKAIVQAQEGTRFDRAHFRNYGDSALEFEVVYYVNTPDYNIYMDIQQAINLELYRRFEEKKIDFAYPTRTLYLAGGGGDQPLSDR